MFADRSLEAVSFNSQLSTTKSELPANVQTTEIVYNESPVQTIETRTVETQTITEEKKMPDVNYDKLAEFLNRVTPGILEALDESYETTAFENYEPRTDEDTLAATKLLQKINCPDETNSKMIVMDMSLSIGGGTLAVSYGIPYHETWCNHRSTIQFYNRSKDGSYTHNPSKTLETDACASTLAYHPTEPSILAAGLFNGSVLVWNLNDVSLAHILVCTHGDSVSRVHWWGRTIYDISFLVSCSKDGYIHIHKLTANYTTACQYKRLKVPKEYNPVERSRPRSAGGTRERAVESGLCITTFDFSFRNPTFFVVGTLCGGIYKCSLDQVAAIEGDESVMDPVIDKYESHEGSITCIKCSPIRNLFVTAGTDKEIRIYDFEEHTCLRSISVEKTIVGLTWMIGNQDVVACHGAGSDIQLYNVTDGTSMTNVKFEPNDRINISCVRVNLKDDTVAIGDTKGNIEIWKVPRQLF